MSVPFIQNLFLPSTTVEGGEMFYGELGQSCDLPLKLLLILLVSGIS